MRKSKKLGVLFALLLCLGLLLGASPASKAGDGYQVTAADGVEQFVTRLYKYCLGRNPDPDGLAAYCDALRGGHITGGAATKSFFLSNEYTEKNTSNSQFLTTLYKAMFDRNPDQGGFDGWMNAMNNGMSRPEVVDGFIYSSEFINLCMRYGIIPYEGFVATRWGVYNLLCCSKGGSLLFQMVMDGATKNSTSNSCSTSSTWEGYAYAAPGSDKAYSYLLQGCGVTVRGTGTWRTTFEADKCYLIMAKLSGNYIVLSLAQVTDCSSPNYATAGGDGYRLNAVEAIEIPLSKEMEGLSGPSAQ